MSNPEGLFVVIDGSDGTGKETQHRLTIARLQENQIAYEPFDFPRYGQPSAYFLEKYLQGGYGDAKNLDPRTRAVLFAVDRFEASPAISHARATGKLAISNRFTIANMIHHAAKMEHPEDRQAFYEWVDEFEHSILRIPKPTLNFIMTIPHTIALANIEKRAVEDNRKKDLHENDTELMMRSIDAAVELTELYPDYCIPINCAKNDTEMRSREDINDEIWNHIQSRLSA